MARDDLAHLAADAIRAYRTSAQYWRARALASEQDRLRFELDLARTLLTELTAPDPAPHRSKK